MLSVVIPSFNRAANLRLCLLALLRQSDSDFEIIVADDGSMDETRAVVTALQAQRWGPALRYVHCGPNLGVRTGRARNIGAANVDPAATHMLMFDSDLVAPPHLIAEFRQQIAAFGGVLLGRVDWLEPVAHDTITGWLEAGNWEAIAGHVPAGMPTKIEGTFSGRELRCDIAGMPAEAWTAETFPLPYSSALALPLNSCYPLDLFWKAGGFDESITGYGFQDMIFGHAVSRLSPQCRAAGRALAYHVWHPKSAPERLHREAQCNLDTLIRRAGLPWSYADQVDWRFWWHYSIDRGGSVERAPDATLWAVNYDRTKRLQLARNYPLWIDRLGGQVRPAAGDLMRIPIAGHTQETELDGLVMARRLLSPLA